MFRKLVGLAFVCWHLAIAVNAQHKEIVLSPSAPNDASWEKEYWSKKEYYKIIPSLGSAHAQLCIDADSMTHARWYKKIPARPYAVYRISLKIKCESVIGDTPESGAGLRIGDLKLSEDKIFKGTKDWTVHSVEIQTGGNDSFVVECMLGKKGRAKGKVWFAEITMQLLSAKELSPDITIDISQTKEPMSPYIYGQFIEHMGRCIYGGIWAEMLVDRKFFYVPGDKRSPWQVMSATVVHDSLNTYSPSNKSLLFSASPSGNSGIAQENLGLIRNMKYTGRVVVKGSPGVSELIVTLSWGSASDESMSRHLKLSEKNFQVFLFEFTSAAKTDTGKLTINAVGKGTVNLAAVSLMPGDNINGFRSDVINLMKELDAPVYRWPGGNFVSGYNWKDGIGDRDKRPTRYERAWNGLEYNDVGIHEFMQLCEILNTEPNIAVNTGLGTAALAAEEVEYVNGDRSTRMGKWRTENGHPDPYDVKLWAVGNEMFGDWQLGHMPIEKYVEKHNDVATAMRNVDPDIELIAVGFPGRWNDMMYKHCANNMTYISEHFYKQDWHAGGLMTHVKQMPDVIREVAEEHRRCRREIPELVRKEIKIAMDEWNYWYGPHVYGLLGTRYFLRDALGIAAGLNEFSRQSDIYFMANYAQTVNVIGAIKTTKTRSFLEGTGQVLKLYRQQFGTVPVAIEGSSAPLDVSAALSDNGKYLTISVINPTIKEVMLKTNVRAQIKEDGIVFVLTGKDDMVYNEFDQQRITVTQQPARLVNNTLTIPAISACVFRFPVR